MKQNPQPFIQVYVLCHNRTQFVKEAVASVLKQSYLNFEVIVSDNSADNDVFEELNTGDDLNKFRYIRRPNLSLAEHQNEILAEVSAPYFMMFHDDDVLQKNALQRLMAGFQNDQTVAVGANATILQNIQITGKLYYPELLENKVLNSPEELATHYLDPEKGSVPFSVYLYKTEHAQKNKFDFKEGRDFANAAFLLKLSASGPFVWLSDTLVSFRLHEGNAPMGIDVRTILSFCRFIKNNFAVPEQVLSEFKMKKLVWWRLQQNNPEKTRLSKHRESVILKASILFLVSNPLVVFQSLLRRIRKLKR